MKADYLSIIFITDNPLLSSGAFDYDKLEPEEKELYNMFSDAVAAAQPKIPIGVTVKTMSKYAHLDIVDLEKWGIHRFPAIRLYASYPDKKQAWYNLQRGPFDLTLNVDQQEITDRLIYLYKGEFGQPSLICKIFPPLCGLSKWAWLAVSIGCAYKAANSPARLGQMLWLGGAGLGLHEFGKRGGFNKTQKTGNDDG